MSYLLFVIVKVVKVALYSAEIVLFVSALFSLLGMDEDNFLFSIVLDTADFILMPVRFLCDKSEFLSSLPIDVSYLFAFMIIELMLVFLPSVLI